MKDIYRELITALFLLLFSEILSAQDLLNRKQIFPQGLSLQYGIGNYSVTDEYISKEKYSGSLPYYKITWSNSHQSYIYNLSLEFQSSSDIKSYNVSTDIYRFSLNQSFNYALPVFKFLNKEIYTFIGPSAELLFYFNEQNIAVSGFDYAQSYVMLISGGISSQIFFNLMKDLNLEGYLNFSVLSLGFHIVDSEETNEKPVKILTLFSGTNLSIALGPRYYLFNNLSLKTAYIFQLMRISSWEPLLSAGDNLMLTLTYGF